MQINNNYAIHLETQRKQQTYEAVKQNHYNCNILRVIFTHILYIMCLSSFKLCYFVSTVIVQSLTSLPCTCHRLSPGINKIIVTLGNKTLSI